MTATMSDAFILLATRIARDAGLPSSDARAVAVEQQEAVGRQTFTACTPDDFLAMLDARIEAKFLEIGVGHFLTLTVDGDDDARWTVECRYTDGDREKPCRMFADHEAEDSKVQIEGCGVLDHLEAAGREKGVAIDDEIVSARIPVRAWWDSDHPIIGPVQ